MEQQNKEDIFNGKTISRAVQLDPSMVEEEKRTIEVAFSSEEVVRQWFGYEILDHDQMDIEFLASGRAPVLKDHDKTLQVGVVERAWIDADRRGRAVLRFGRSELAESEFRDVKDGIRLNISTGYEPVEVLEETPGKRQGEPSTYRLAVRPFEISLVSVPADMTVGVGRHKSEKKQEDKPMTQQVETKTEAPKVEVTREAPPQASYNVEAEVRSAREKEMNRIREIEALCSRHDLKDMQEDAIRAGTSLEVFRGQILDRIGNKPAKLPEGEVPMNDKEKRSYSLLKAIDALERGDWSKAGLEKECSRELEIKYGKSARGLFVPTNLSWQRPTFENAGHRDLTVASTNGGSKLKGTDQRGDLFIDALRAELILSKLGVTVLTGLQGDVAIPSLSGKTTVAFMTNETTAVTEGAPTFGQVSLAPKELSGYVDISRKLMIQSDPSVEQIVRNDIISQIANKIEDVAFEGGGTGEPSGLINESNINVVALGAAGAAPTWAKVLDMIQQVAIDNGLKGRLAFAMTPQAWYKLGTTAKVASTDSQFILDPSAAVRNLVGYPYEVSTNIPSDLTKSSGSSLSAMFFGNWQDLMLAFWTGVDIVVDKSSLSTIGATRLCFFQDLDVKARHGESFSVIKDMVTS